MKCTKLASLFQNNAVLQRNQNLPVWGWTEPKSKVKATLSGHTAFAFANEHGRFELMLPPNPAGGPHELKVENTDTSEVVTVSNILFGEVWLASGQSNMEWTMKACGEKVIPDTENAHFPEFRFFCVKQSTTLGGQETVEGEWVSISPESVLDCSAVAFSFGRELHKELAVPIGIIVSSRGGTIIESWTSRSGLIANPKSAEICTNYNLTCHTPERFNNPFDKSLRYDLYPTDPGNIGMDKGWAKKSFQDSDWLSFEIPNTWQSQGYPESAVFWFRKRLFIPSGWEGKSLRLNLGRIDKHDVTYFNGFEVGRTGKDNEVEHWQTVRSYVIPPELVEGGEAIVAVRVYSFAWDGGMLGPDEYLKVHPVDDPTDAISLTGVWQSKKEHDFGVIETNPCTGHNQPNSCHMLFDNMIAPLIPYAIKGAIWYQGESNVSLNFSYAEYLKSLIQDWRYIWAQKELPFHVVQLPEFGLAEDYQHQSNWAALRSAQSEVFDLPNTGLAVTLGLGEENDLHPSNKMPVGQRLAHSVLVSEYDKEGMPSGPKLSAHTVLNGEVICTFDFAGEGLKTIDGLSPSGFFIAGEDKRWLPAVVRLEGNQLTATNPDIERPLALRYAWANTPKACNLCNSDMQIAGTFRTDNWDLY